MLGYRVYIDESGDHTYRDVEVPNRRYLGLTGILIRQDQYDSQVRVPMEQMKKAHFPYDPDSPPVLVRSQIIRRKGPFWTLRDPERRLEWGDALIQFMSTLPISIYTVVIDKHAQFSTYGTDANNPYEYCLRVLLNRIREGLHYRNGMADVVAEARGKREDAQLLSEYEKFRRHGDQRRTAREVQAVYPLPLRFLRKDQNIAGLQIADLLAYPQKMEIVEREGLPMHAPLSAFSRSLNSAVQSKIGRYGQYLLR